jgi:heavy metal sensor kinase
MREHIWLWKEDSSIYQCSHFPAPVTDGSSMKRLQFRTAAIQGEWLRVVDRRVGSYRLQVGEQITAIEHTLHESAVLIAISIPLVILLSIVSGYYLVRRLLRPLDAIVHRAKRISSENLSERIPRPGTNDEVDRVVVTLNQMIERLEKSFQQLEQFTANASHELRTPLTILKGELEIVLQRPRSGDEYRAVLGSNLEEVVRISHTVEQLFLLARMDSNSIVPEFEQVELRSLLEEIAREARFISKERNVSITTELAAVPSIEGDTVMLVQLFLNLIENGIKYNREGGLLRITLAVPVASGETQEVKIEISDTGIGIAQENINAIFERFYRVDKGASQSQGGAGLGLAIAQWIVRLHRGRIDVRSRPGKGSIFTVTLPVRLISRT